VRVGRRSLFFAGVAAVCLVLLPATPSEFRWLNLAMAGLALVWAIAIGVEEIVGRGVNRREQP
jgi:hypothetical protein